MNNKNDVVEEIEDMCPNCVTPWKCNGCDEHVEHNCQKCSTPPSSWDAEQNYQN